MIIIGFILNLIDSLIISLQLAIGCWQMYSFYIMVFEGYL